MARLGDKRQIKIEPKKTALRSRAVPLPICHAKWHGHKS